LREEEIDILHCKSNPKWNSRKEMGGGARDCVEDREKKWTELDLLCVEKTE
jgi:hypothetical protein